MSFFDKISNPGEMRKAYRNPEVEKCSSEIAAYENEIRNTYTEIGERVYEAGGVTAEDAFKELFEFIDSRKKQIEGLQNRIQELDNVKRCKACGAELIKGSNFCGYCGAKVEEEKPAEQGKRCPNCGGSVSEKAKFCMSCGTKIEMEKSETAPSEQNCTTEEQN